MTVKEKKKSLIKQEIFADRTASLGMKAVSHTVLSLFLIRTALFVFELIFFSIKDIKLSVISNILLLPFFFILYMIFDGNRGIIAIPEISAVVRVIVYFSTTHKALGAVSFGGAYTGVFLACMVLQFALCILIQNLPACSLYFKKMQGINFKLQKEIMNSGSRR